MASDLPRALPHGWDYLGGMRLHPEHRNGPKPPTEAAARSGHDAIQDELKRIYAEGVSDAHEIVKRTNDARDAAIMQWKAENADQ